MLKTALHFIKIYLMFILVFVVLKFVFIGCYYKLYSDISFFDFSSIILHGLKLDAAVAGYFTIIPALLLCVAQWGNFKVVDFLQKVYCACIALFISVCVIADLVLYEHWGFRLDSTPFFYFFSSPREALGSGSTLMIFIGAISVLVLFGLLYYLFTRVILGNKAEMKRDRDKGLKIKNTLILILLTGLLFIPIRGGFNISSNNISRVYYSTEMKYNHAATNPIFSLLESLTRSKKFSSQYRFMPDDEASAVFSELVEQKPDENVLAADSLSVPQLFTTERPNILFFVLESFMSKTMQTLGGLPNIAINMDEFAKEGISFTNFYANGFRTDKGLVAIFSAYPAQPTTSIMKYPRKTQNMPSLPRVLKNEGYNLQYYFGGDPDFTNMRSYLYSMGIDKIMSYKDFPLDQQLRKNGALDHLLLQRVISDLKNEQPQEPFMKIIQTSSSHSPYDVPFYREGMDKPYYNTVAYADSCIGSFVQEFKKTKLWDNTIIVLVADHTDPVEGEINNAMPERYHIPFVIIGGPVSKPRQIDVYGSQIDIIATLLHQFNIPSDEFIFSKNLLNDHSPHFAFYTFPNLFGMITDKSQVVYDCESDRVLFEDGESASDNLIKGKAFLQKLYDDIDRR